MPTQSDNKIIIDSKCPLCGALDIYGYHSDKKREYLECQVCSLVFVPELYFLSEHKEKKRYDTHNNSQNNQGYRNFLSRTFLPMSKIISQESLGLDFGSGPGPTLSVMFQEIGHQVDLYDYFYAQDTSVFDREYDFITATEVIEHLYNPQEELDRLWDMLIPGGVLGVMTKFVLNKEAFSSWHYINDLTHVCFFSKSTFFWLAKKWNAKIEFVDKDVIFFYKTTAN
jgi:hypothetical protein